MLELIFAAIANLFSKIGEFQNHKKIKKYKSPIFRINFGEPKYGDNHCLFTVKIKNDGVSSVSHVVVWGKDIGKLDSGEEKNVDFVLPKNFDLYESTLYVSCLTEFGEVCFNKDLLDKNLFIRNKN